MTLANILLESIRYSYKYWIFLYEKSRAGLYQQFLAVSNVIYTYMPDDEIVSILDHVKILFDINSNSEDMETANGIVFAVQTCLRNTNVLDTVNQNMANQLNEVYPWEIYEDLTLDQLRASFINPIDWANKVLKCLKSINLFECYDALNSKMKVIQEEYNTIYAHENKKMFSMELESGHTEYAFSTRDDLQLMQQLSFVKDLLSLLTRCTFVVDSFIKKDLTSVPFTMADREDVFLNSLDIFNNELKELSGLYTLILNLINKQSIPVNMIEKNSYTANKATGNAVECIREEEKGQIDDHNWFFFLCPCANMPIDDGVEHIPPVHN